LLGPVSYPLDADGCTPVPTVRFDCILNDNAVTFQNYRVNTFATFGCYGGKPYVFRSHGNFLDLYAE
jgi:hypothetical protein